MTTTSERSVAAPRQGGSVATFRVHVAPVDRGAPASGIVRLTDEKAGSGEQDLGAAVLDADGNATIASNNLAAGAHTIRAQYAGDDSFAASVSSAVEVTAEATGVAGFTATANPAALSVAQGNAGTTTISLTPVNGFSDYVSLSCSGLPADTACTFTPTNVFVSGTTASISVLSIETYGPTGPDAAVRTSSRVVYALVLPGMLALGGLGLRGRRSLRRAGLLMLLVAGFVLLGTGGLLSGCSQRYHYLNKAPAASPGTALGSATISIQAQAVSGVVVTTPQTPLSIVLTVTAP